MLSRIREEGFPVLLVSAGDVYGSGDAYNRLKCRFISRMMGRFGYDAVALGERDLGFGLEAVVEDSRETGLNIVCANLLGKAPPSGSSAGDAGGTTDVMTPGRAGEPVFPPFRIVEKHGVKFGVIGVLSPAVKNRAMALETGSVEALTYIIESPIPVLNEWVPRVREQSDVVVLLAHMERSELDSVLAAVDGVDIAVLGHSNKPSVTAEPVVLQGVPVYMASHQGQYLGRVRLELSPDNRLAGSENEIILLDRTIPDDKTVAELVDEFETENRSYQKKLFAEEQLGDHSKPGHPRDVYLGVATCQRCHEQAFDSYIMTRHARAYGTLSALFKHRDSGCVPCHTTGYGEPGGYRGTRLIGATVDLVDVQCEACHGPGEQHSRDGRYSQAARESCVGCHTGEQDPDFDFAKAWEHVAH